MWRSVQTTEIHQSVKTHCSVLSYGITNIYQLNVCREWTTSLTHLFSLLQKDAETFPFVRFGALMQTVDPLNEDR